MDTETDISSQRSKRWWTLPRLPKALKNPARIASSWRC
jgi:hypothetical protein